MGTTVTEEVARSFLLGDADASEQRRIESLFLTDREIRETILLVEESLLEDYLEGNLAAEDIEKFVRRYGANSRDRRRLRIAQSIREHAMANSRSIQPQPSIFVKLREALPGWTVNQPLAMPLLASLAIAVIVAAVWIGLRMNRTAREREQQALIERQLADLNSPRNLSTNQPQMLSLTIAPITVRSLRPSAQLAIQSASQVIELSLLWPQKEEYPGYQATLSHVGGTRVLVLPPLHVDQSPGGRRVRLRLPAELLPDGLNRIELKGVGTDGSAGPAEEYDFLINRR